MVSYPLYFPHPLILNMTIFVVAPLLLLLHDLDSLLPSAFHHALLVPTPCAAPPLRISCSGSLPCPFDTRSTSEHLALNVLHTTFSSDSPGAITCLMVYWVATCPKSSPSLVTQVCTWSSLRLWLTEGSRDQAGGQLHLLWLCLPRCSFKCNILHFSVLNLTSQTEYIADRVFINVPSISQKLLHMVLPQFHFYLIKADHGRSSPHRPRVV